MDKNQKIALAKEIGKHITACISDVWPGFSPVPFILYDDKTQVAVGAGWPKRYKEEQEGIWVAQGADPHLMGNTSTMYHGVQIAIWDIRTWPDNPDISRAAADIAHEMFHAFQQTSMELPRANEMLMPKYPHSPRSLALVIEENKWLVKILANPDAACDCMEKIVALRKEREAELGTDFFTYDKLCESSEGTAAYVEIHMKAILEGKTPFEAAASYQPLLMNKENLLTNYRHRCYAAGLVLCLAADVLWPGWQNEWQNSGVSIFDWVKDKLMPAESENAFSLDLETAADLIAIFQSEKERKINEFSAQPLTAIKGDVELLGFDPMNLICVDGRCLHRMGILRINGVEEMISTPFLVEFGENIMDVRKVFVCSAP
jgi:hypothetical protein